MAYTTGRFMFSLALLFVLLYFSPFSVVITSIGDKELVYVVLVHVFVYFARINVCHFSLPLGIRVWMRLVIMTLLGHLC